MDTTLPPSFFVIAGGAFVPTVATRGPWSADHQHGGPPAALLARAIEAGHDGAALRVARFTVVFHRPVAVSASYRTDVEIVLAGRKVKIVRARLFATDDDAPVVSADALLVRRLAVPAAGPSMAIPDDGFARPDRCEPFSFPFFRTDAGYHVAMELRRIHGHFGEGAGGLWMRMRIPLLPGETPSPLQRVVCAADSGSGISVGVDLDRYTFLNPDLTVTLARELCGEWLGVDTRTSFGDDGIGLADSRLLDELGVVGRGVQPLVLEAR